MMRLCLEKVENKSNEVDSTNLVMWIRRRVTHHNRLSFFPRKHG